MEEATKKRAAKAKKKHPVTAPSAKPRKRVVKNAIAVGTSSSAVKEILREKVRPAVRSFKYIATVGRRKTAVARIRRHTEGTGTITINGMPLDSYFNQEELREIVRSPLMLVDPENRVDYTVKVHGGGSHSQAEAIRHGLARALIIFDKTWRVTLKRAGWLKRDARVKERKKPGLKRARRAPQWQKR